MDHFLSSVARSVARRTLHHFSSWGEGRPVATPQGAPMGGSGIEGRGRYALCFSASAASSICFAWARSETFMNGR